MGLDIPFLSYEDLRARADALLKKHYPTVRLPIPIEKIVEFGFQIEIIPVPGLMRVHEVDAFSSKDFKTIMVDQSVMESRSPYRYRFSLAHELGHAVLHQEVQRQLEFSTIKEWKQVINSVSERDRGWFEWQAYNFAGLMLVPRESLRDSLKQAVKRATEQGIALSSAEYADVSKDYVCNWLGRKFEVSAEVVSKRLEKDGLWPA